MRFGSLVLLAFAAGCDRDYESLCEVEVNEATICLSSNFAGSQFCEEELGGVSTPTRGEDGKYTYCEDLYEIECVGTVTHEDSSSDTAYGFHAVSEEDCAAADGGSVGD